MPPNNRDADNVHNPYWLASFFEHFAMLPPWKGQGFVIADKIR